MSPFQPLSICVKIKNVSNKEMHQLCGLVHRNHIIPYNYFELFIRFTQDVYQFYMTPVTSSESIIPVTSHAFLIFLNRRKCQPWYCNALRGNWWDDVIFLALVFGFQISSCLSLWVIIRKYCVCSGREKTHFIFLLRKI